ncbi:oligosaccharide flippase family protein [Microbacterium sp. KSW4-11]|uniref:Oligosaccharide flippase family protein n=1 Tax=Microbacterium gawkjiense TaxID=3067309 RepID=A0ABU3GA92_9MICO|nr:hypothetical protein [Microbacterium sp. KSW4-11]MDT3316722.1 oligosaccharide flippase family protein [Microbacterium sp. KSW4-11]
MIERVVNRGASAVVGLVVAVFVSPSEAGLFAMASLVLTFFQAIGDQTIRQIGVRVSRHVGGPIYIRRFSALLGGLTLLAVTGFIFLAGLVQIAQWNEVIKLAPLAIVPIAMVWSLPNVVSAQATGGWLRLARAQWVASLGSLCVALPLAPLVGIAAAAAQSAVAEILILVLLRRKNVDGELPRVRFTSRFLVPTALSGTLGWVQGQADRLVVSILAGTSLLGVLSLASSVARVPADAALAGYVNLIRAELGGADDQVAKRVLVQYHLTRVLTVAASIQVTIILLSVSVLSRFLNDDWDAALKLVPLLTASVIPSAVVWVLSAVLIDSGRAAVLIPWQFVGVALSSVSGFAFAASLFWGAVIAWGRDIIALAARGYLARRVLNARSVAALCAFVVAGALLAMLGYLWALSAI